GDAARRARDDGIDSARRRCARARSRHAAQGPGEEPMRSLRLPLVAVTALLCAGCALTSKSDPVTLRYFTPDAVPSPTRAAVAADGAGRGLELRISRVNAAANIK